MKRIVKCVVVLGCHRSGTSMVAGMLHALGVNMGERFREPDQHNSGGYWEDLDWRDLDQHILAAAGGSWWEPPSMRSILGCAPLFSPGARALADVRDARGGPWGFKDPRACLTLPTYVDVLADNTLFVVVDRDLTAVLDSLQRRATLRGYVMQNPKGLVVEYLARRERFLAQVDPGRVMRLWYEAVTTRPTRWAEKLAQGLGLEVSASQIAAAALMVQQRTRPAALEQGRGG